MIKKLIVLGLLQVTVQIAAAQTSPHGSIQIQCENCHTTETWKIKSDTAFNHASTGFDLTGAHTMLTCKICHQKLVFTGLKGTCQFCHTDVHKGELGMNCLRCHTTKAWKIADMIQRHEQTRFPLVGRHASADCQVCHARNANQQYTGTPISCIGCHRTDYQNAQNPNHTLAGFSTDCIRCHQMNATFWGGSFDHQLTAFPLTGAHRAVQCSKCHTTTTFKSTSQDCYACHTNDYNTVQNPNHAVGKFSRQCASCHTTTAWRPSQFTHDHTSFALVGAHRTVTCEQCHVNGQFSGLSQNCIDCHKTDFNRVQNPNHAAGSFSTQCLTCHTMGSWKPATFDHASTKFALTGKHTTVQCQSCHTNGNYQLAYTSCYQCHQTDFNQVTNPNHVTGNFSHSCETCHSTTSWSSATFDHASTKFALTGKHTTVQCPDCHTNGNYQLAYINCYQCHQTDFNQVTNPNHVTGNFSRSCETCHSTTSWSSATFDHASTKFALTGKHTTVQCQSCHTNGNYQLAYINCYQCHQTDFNQVTNPNHVTGNFSRSCETCHSTTSWSSATFDHASTKFALTGKHATVQCPDCHTNGNYQLAYINCYQCHQTDFNQVMNPNHVTGNFSHSCETCHSTTSWSSATFDHASTKFALTGKHTTVQCPDCHTNGNYQLAYINCYQCHQTDFNQVTNPNHVTGNFSRSCEMCHSTTSWSSATFDHSTTKFSLTGKHATVQCPDCHTNGNYQLAYINCYQCHQTDFNQVTNPNHVTGNFSHSCETCHSTIGWSPASFDHSTTKFSLTGKHVTAQCISCHVNNNYQLVYFDCYACHQTDYQTPVNPNHATGNFGHTCDQCHTTTVWSPSTFNHSTTTFPLAGAHQAVLCANCHLNNVYAGLHQNCIDCHQTEYNGTTNPSHLNGNFSKSCLTCHTMNGWSPASFDHTATKFTLTGKHTTTPCSSCHTNNNFQLAYSNCYQCHQTDFQQAANPRHTVGYPQTCDMCHSTVTWTSSTFDHDAQYFRVYSGKHQGKWSTCSQCHSGSNDFVNFTCTTSCHPQSEMNNVDNHTNNPAYSYDSQKCYTCHRTI